VNIDQMMKALAMPFRPEEIEWRVGVTTADKKSGIALPYVKNRAIMNRLDEVAGCFGWRNEFQMWRGDSQLCGISLRCPVTNEWITKWDGASDSDIESTKGGLSDSMKRAAVQWGIGRYLYKMPTIWVPLKPVGKSYHLAEIPKLPLWAVPDGHVDEPEVLTGLIDKDQAIALFKAAEGCANPNEIVGAAMKAKGYTSSMQIKRADYAALLQEVIAKAKKEAA